MAPGHLHGDSLCSTPGIYYWMRVRRPCDCSGRARPRDRSATARAVALDSTSHRLASPGRGLPRRQRRRVTRRSGRGRSEAVAVPNRVRRRGSSTVLNRGAVGGPPVRIRVRQALQPIAIRHRAPHRELVVRFGGAVLPHGDRLQGSAAYPGGFSCRISAQPQATAYTSCTFSGSRHSFQVLPPSRVPKTWPRRATL